MTATMIVACTEMGAWDLLKRESVSPVWSASMAITVDGALVDEYMYDVPVLVRLVPPSFDSSVSRLDGRDIGFFSEPFEIGLQPLDHAIAGWDPDGISFFWVRVPLITPGGSYTFYMHIGNETASVPENPEGVWRNGYAAVLGFDNAGDRYADATRFANHGEVNVNGQTEPRIVPGVIGSAIEMTRNSDAVLIPDGETVRSLAPFTISVWVNVSDAFQSSRVFDKSVRYLSARPSGSQRRFQSRFQYEQTPPAADELTNDVFREWTQSSPPVDTWTNITMRWNGAPDSGQLQLFLDGVSATAFNQNAVVAGDERSDAGSPLAIGNSAGFGATAAFDGQMDHVEISFVNRSSDWIRFHVDTVNQTNMSYGPLVVR
jgi:hypothetical protein